MNLYCIYLMSNFYVSQPTTFHVCKLQQAQKTEMHQAPIQRETQAQKNIREALAFPILFHIQEQQKTPSYSRHTYYNNAHNRAGFTITF